MTSRIPAFFVLIATVLLAFAPRAEAVIQTGMGRYLQIDPLASGLTLIEDPLWLHGTGRQLDLPDLDLAGRYADGTNLFQYLRSNPPNNSDPLGLYTTAWAAPLAPGFAAAIVQNALIWGTNAAMSGATWAVSVTDSGALVAGANYHNLAMWMSQGDANWNNWINEISNWGSAGGGGGQPPQVLQTGGRTINESTRNALGLTRDQAKRAIEGLKHDTGRAPSNHSHKIWSNGNVTDSNTGRLIGNLFDYIH